MGRMLTIVLASVALTGCDLVVQHAEDRAVAELGNMAGNLSLNVGGDYLKGGKIDLGGVPLMEGATMTGVNVAVGANGPVITADFTAPTTPQEAKAYFLREFAAKQLAVTQAAQAISGVTPDGAAFRIDLGQATGGATSGTIRIDPAR